MTSPTPGNPLDPSAISRSAPIRQVRQPRGAGCVLTVGEVDVALKRLEVHETLGLGLCIDIVAVGAIVVEGEEEGAILGHDQTGELRRTKCQHIAAEAAEGEEEGGIDTRGIAYPGGQRQLALMRLDRAKIEPEPQVPRRSLATELREGRRYESVPSAVRAAWMPPVAAVRASLPWARAGRPAIPRHWSAVPEPGR